MKFTLSLRFSSSRSCLSIPYSSNIANRGTPSYAKDMLCSSSHARVLATNVSTMAFCTNKKHPIRYEYKRETCLQKSSTPTRNLADQNPSFLSSLEIQMRASACTVPVLILFSQTRTMQKQLKIQSKVNVFSTFDDLGQGFLTKPKFRLLR